MFRSLTNRFRRSEQIASLKKALDEQRRITKDQEREIRRLRGSGAAGQPSGGSDLASRVVWIFGGGRSGTTWMANMMRDMSRQEVWFEPNIGEMFDPQNLRIERRRNGKHFILSDEFRNIWQENVRSFVLDGIEARFPGLAKDSHVMIKEPGGSVGAKVLAESLSESRMILLVRDPRDVISSWKDAVEEGSWNYERIKGKGEKPSAFAAGPRAKAYVKLLTQSLAAYEDHPALKTIVRYEDLVADTSSEMERMYSEVGVPVDTEELVRVVEKHSWANIPEEDKGQGKFYRRGSSGGWREDLTAEEAQSIERMTARIMDRLGYERSVSPGP